MPAFCFSNKTICLLVFPKLHYNHNFCLQSQSHSAVIKPRFHELIGKMRKKFQMPILDANQSISSIGVNGVISEIEDAEKLHGL